MKRPLAWKRNGDWISPAVGGMKKPGSGGGKISDVNIVGYSREDADITMTGGLVHAGPVSAQRVRGRTVYLRHKGDRPRPTTSPSEHFKLPGYGTVEQKVMIVEVHPPRLLE